MSSCEKFFRPEEFYLSNIKSEEELLNAVVGINDKFKSQINYYHNFIDLFGDDRFTKLFGEPLTPASVKCYSKYYNNPTSCFKGGENIRIELKDWKENYALIASINNLLSQFELEEIDSNNLKELIGECFFYRAWSYFRLIRIYGKIPIIDNPDVSYSVPRSSYKEIYEFIEKDLLKAIDLLPLSNISSRIPYETPNQGISKALLGEVYLSWAGFPVKDETKYGLSAKITEELIDSASYYDYELLLDFEDLWNKNGDKNKESILCIYADRPDNHNFNVYHGRMKTFVKENSGLLFGIDSTTGIEISMSPVPEINFYNNYPKNYRKDITFFTRIYVPKIEYFPEIDTGYFDIDITDCKSRAAYRKFFIDTFLIEDPMVYSNYKMEGCPRMYLLRYAQTLLTYAEASAKSNNLNEKSYECINKIRRRANKLPLDSPSIYDLTPGLSPEAFSDSVVQERAWELAGEPGHRWFDMVRLEIVEKVFDSRDPNDGELFEYTNNDKYFFPIPEHDIDLNPNLGE